MMLWLLTAFSFIQFARPTEKRFSVQQRPLLIVQNSAELFCNYTANREKIEAVKATLFKGVNRSVKVCSFECNTTCQPSNLNGTELNCQVKFNKTEKVFNFNLQNLHVNQTDIYICRIEVISHPPYESEESRGTVIHVIAAEPESQQEPPKHSMAMIAAVGALGFYNVLITAALFHCWFKKKNRTIRNDYFNMIQWKESNGPKKRHPSPTVLSRNYTAYRSWEP